MKYLVITIVLFLLFYLVYRTYRHIKLAEGLDLKIEKGAVILDVRTAAEYQTGHIEGAINLSLGEIRERYRELDPAITYITTCSHGLRSVKAETLLRERGFKDIYNGGAWIDLQKIIEKKK